MRIITYARWLKTVLRRLEDDISRDRRRQEWWKQHVSISPLAIINTDSLSTLIIGCGSSIGPYAVLDLLSDPLATSPSPSVLRIGQRTAINEFNSIRAAGAEIVIGDYCLLSQYVAIIGSNHGTHRDLPMRDQPWVMDRAGVFIGNDVWIGTHAVILPGVSIGNGSIIAAGAVVTHDIPEFSVAAGVPAVVKKRRE